MHLLIHRERATVGFACLEAQVPRPCRREPAPRRPEPWWIRAIGPWNIVVTQPGAGGGDVLRRFEGTLTFERTPATDGGALVCRAYSAREGSVWQAAVLRVHF